MSLLYISENGAVVSIEANRVKIKYKDGMVRSIPIETLESITLLGKSQITTQMYEECLKRGISVSYFSKGGKYFGRLTSTTHIKARLQRMQSSLYDTEFSLVFSKKIIAAKIRNQEVVLRRYAKSRNIDVEKHIFQMKNSEGKVSYCAKIAEIMGYEGIAAREYFDGLSACIEDDFKFKGRTKRPPMDLFNSMISLGYSILMNEIYSEIESKGLNPYFGFMHRDDENHPTLASDLMEEWRAVIVDATVMSMINGHEVDIEDFYREIEEPGCFLGRNALKLFINKLETKLNTSAKYIVGVDYPVDFRRAIAIQTDKLVKAIMNMSADEYIPVVIR